MPNILYKDESITYEIVRKKKKNIAIHITPDGTVRVTSPEYIGDGYINDIVYKRADWILSRLKLVKDINKNMPDRIYSRGDGIVFQGMEYKLKVIEEVEVNEGIRLKDGEFEVHVNAELDEEEREAHIKEFLKEWYRHEAFKVFKERTRFYSEILKLYPNNIRVKEQKSLWGSCSTKNNINFNWKLIMAPPAVLDYIVVHELCHLKHRDHSKNFWGLVEQIIPDYKEKRSWLRENGRSLKI